MAAADDTRIAATLDAQNQAAAAGRRAELIRFADEFEAAVGSIVANVSASADQLEAIDTQMLRHETVLAGNIVVQGNLGKRRAVERRQSITG